MDSGQSRTLENGYRHVTLGDVESTNLICAQYAQQGDPGGLWVTAERQLAGRGSRGRDWISEKGNLYASLLLREPGELKLLHTLTFTASLAIRDAIYGLPGAELATVTLKWPNDVLLNGKKTSGILLESHVEDGVRYVVIGMGINVSHHPANTLHVATDLGHENIVTSVENLFGLLNLALTRRLSQWSRGQGFEETRADWLNASAGLGTSIEIKMPNEDMSKSGIFQGIDENGLLILKTAGGRLERISVADIFFA